MLKTTLRSSIIVLIQVLLLMMAFVLVTPWLLNQSSSLQHFQQQLIRMQPVWMLLHATLYLTIIAFWPRLIHRLQQRKESDPSQLRTIMNTRWYLIALFLLIDCLMLWKSI